MTTVEHLRAARTLYASAPSHAAPYTDPAIGKYCVIYALTEARDRSNDRFGDSRDALLRVIGTSSIVAWNHEHTTEEVLAAWDEAIANEEAREQEFTATPVTAIPDAIPA